ncbi:hypothetical protein ACQR16_20435 [Bradyrhizobium oligotrophicum]|uniref:hypothetical protein n=1 Tax=Bradyrhizobium oligotrophicum TaxID=44255 RepID=UPI003EBA08F4
MKNSSADFPTLNYKPCRVVVIGDRNCFIWPLTASTKAKIRELLEDETLVIKFNSTLEQIPPYSCAECGIDITLFDTVREAVSSGAHAKRFLCDALQRDSLAGNGVLHTIHCENGHVQPVVMGWPYLTFNWIYDVEETAPAEVAGAPADDVRTSRQHRRQATG